MKLTKNKQALSNIINRHMEREEARLAVRRTMWLLASYYLAGARNFTILDTVKGEVKGTILDEEGRLEFQSQKLLSDINEVVGRITSMDVRPAVERFGSSLGGIRDRSITQILMDSALDEEHLNRVHHQFSWIVSTLGTCGLEVSTNDHPTIGLKSGLEVVHPKELFPFPSIGNDFTKSYGIIRQRYVTVAHLKRIYGGSKINKNVMERMEWWKADPGEEWADILYDEEDLSSTLRFKSPSDHVGSPKSKEQEWTGIVKVRELRILDHWNRVTRYIVQSGDHIIDDQDLDDQEIYCPLGKATFYDNGSWHGVGMFEVLYSMHRELERLMRNLFINTRDIDRYGVVVLPQGQMDTSNMLRDVGKGLKVMFWEPDITMEGFRPFPITPFNSGDVPGKVAGFAQQMLDQLNPIRDLIEEKGRVDSASGLAYLDEQIQKLMTSPTKNVASAYATVYRACAQQLGVAAIKTRRAVPINRLSTDLAGAIINPERDEVSFGDNPLPNVGRLRYKVRSMSYRSEAARKAEALELFRDVHADIDNLKIFAMEEGIDFAMWQDEDRGAYETVVRNILLLYGDGQSPGEIIVTPHTSKPELQIRILQAFMGSPPMMVASVDVQDQFKVYRDTLMMNMGMTLPEGVPDPAQVNPLADTTGVVGRIQPAVG